MSVRPFVVMRRAPMIGQPRSAPRISVSHRAANLAWALQRAQYRLEDDRKQGLRGTGYWVVREGTCAHRAGGAR